MGLLLLGWFFWGNHKRQFITKNTFWQNQYKNISQDVEPHRMQAETLEREITSGVSHTETQENKVELLREDYDSIKNSRDDLKIKLGIAVEHSKEQAKLIEQIRGKPSEIDELKALLGKITERNNLLNIELEKRESEIGTLRGTAGIDPVIDDLKLQLCTTIELNNSLTHQLDDRKQEIATQREKLVDIDELKSQLSQSNGRNQALEKELESQRTLLMTRNKELNSQVLAFSSLKKEFESSDANQKSLQVELDAANSRLAPLEDEIIKHKSNLAALQQQSAEVVLLRSKLDERDQYINDLKQTLEIQNKRIQPLETEVKNTQAFMQGLQSKVEDANKRVPSLEENIRIRDDKITSLENELDPLRKQIAQLGASVQKRDDEVVSLKQELFQVKKKNPLKEELHKRDHRINELEGQLKEAKKIIPISISQQPKAKTAPTESKMKTYGLKKPSRKPDDLKLISGVGQTLESKLNDCGIYYFEQIAGFTRKDVVAVDEMLKFKGRIDREEWIKQARALMRNNISTSKNTLKRSTTAKKQNGRRGKIKPLGMKRPPGELDDLQLITGVGPKLERKLHRLGIYHFEQIANLDRKDIALIDSKLGTYRGRVTRDKWPVQARKLYKKFYT